MSARFRVLLKPIETHPDVVDKIVKAVCVLHNYLISETGISNYLVDHGRNDAQNGSWRRAGEMEKAKNLMFRRANRSKAEANLVRDNLKQYFNNEGTVSWQEKMIQ